MAKIVSQKPEHQAKLEKEKADKIELQTLPERFKALGKRVEDYAPAMLDKLIASGEVVWRRLSSKNLRRGKTV